jgi:hypothetical protein
VLALFNDLADALCVVPCRVWCCVAYADTCAQTTFCSSCVTNPNKCQWCGGISGSCVGIAQTCANNATSTTDTATCSVIAPGTSAATVLTSWISSLFFF